MGQRASKASHFDSEGSQSSHELAKGLTIELPLISWFADCSKIEPNRITHCADIISRLSRLSLMYSSVAAERLVSGLAEQVLQDRAVVDEVDEEKKHAVKIYEYTIEKRPKRTAFCGEEAKK